MVASVIGPGETLKQHFYTLEFIDNHQLLEVGWPNQLLLSPASSALIHGWQASHLLYLQFSAQHP